MIFIGDKDLNEKYGPGTIGIFSATMGRYREFDVCKDSIMTTMGSQIKWAVGLNAAATYNNIIRELRPQDRWVWMMGDDHVFQPDILLRLLYRNVDMVAPLVIRKSYPFMHVIHEQAPDYLCKPRSFLNGKMGLHRLTDSTIGNAGLLVKRKVFDGMEDPWFETGKTHPEFFGADLYFSKKACDAGFELYVDMDIHMGHVFHAAVWPHMRKDGVLEAEIRPAHDIYGECITQEERFEQMRGQGVEDAE